MNIMFFLKPKSELAYIYDYHTLRQAMEIMEYHKYSCVPILNKEGKYVGSITEGDVLWALKKLDIFNIKEAEDISIMKIKRRVDYQCVTAESDMEDLIGWNRILYLLSTTRNILSVLLPDETLLVTVMTN